MCVLKLIKQSKSELNNKKDFVIAAASGDFICSDFLLAFDRQPPPVYAF